MQSAPSRPILLLVRHAHSSWALPGQRDHQRPLDERGRAEAPIIGAAIARTGLRVARVLCSTATRALETLDGIRPSLARGTPERHSDDLYALGVDAYYAQIRGEDGAECLLVIGHNPMVEEFCSSLVGSGEREALQAMREGFGTAAMAVIALDGSFAAIAEGKGHLHEMINP